MDNIESFTFNHTLVDKVPFIRLSKRIEVLDKAGQIASVIKKYDVRLCVPNMESMPPKVIHTLEHILAIELSSVTLTGFEYQYIDFSPMGCQTGFYFTFMCSGNYLRELSDDDVLVMVNNAFRRLFLYDTVPHANEIECGNYKLIDLVTTKNFVARNIRDKFFVYKGK